LQVHSKGSILFICFLFLFLTYLGSDKDLSIERDLAKPRKKLLLEVVGSVVGFKLFYNFLLNLL
jgi:hypothetical protein